MAGAISINILSNVREAVRGVDDVAEALEDAEGRMRDLTKQGDTATDRMESDFRSVARSADRASDELKSKFRDAYLSVRRNSDDAADEVERNQRRMGERSAEVGQEIRQNLGEGIANAARGDFASLADTIGDTLGGAVAGIGGIGTAALGAAGALGLGAIVAVISNIAAESERTKQIASENFREMAEDGVEAWASVQSQTQRLTDAYADHEGEIQKIADLLGLSFEDVAGAWAGIPDQVALVDAAYGDMVNNLQNTFGVTREGVDATVKGWDAVMGPLSSVLDGYDQARQKASILGDQQSKMWEQAISDAESATVAVDEFGNKLVTLPDGTQVVISAETGQATQNLTTFKGDLNSVDGRVVTSTARLLVDDAALARANNYFDSLRRKAEAGITVNMRTVNGRQLI